MGKKDKDLAARRKAYQEKFGYSTQVAIPPGMTLPPGFVNLGNSCLLNSTLQSLTAAPLLNHLLNSRRSVLTLGEPTQIIKKRNPPPPQVRKSKNKTEQASSNDRNGPTPSANPQTIEPESDPLMPFADMVFGGMLASILVCEGCRHISHTYEDFMNLSLSIKPDDIKERKSTDAKRKGLWNKGGRKAVQALVLGTQIRSRATSLVRKNKLCNLRRVVFSK